MILSEILMGGILRHDSPLLGFAETSIFASSTMKNASAYLTLYWQELEMVMVAHIISESAIAFSHSTYKICAGKYRIGAPRQSMVIATRLFLGS